MKLGKRLHHLKRRLVLLFPRHVPFAVAGRSFSIYGTYSANRGLGHDFARNGCHEPVLSRLLCETLVSQGDRAVYWDVGSAIGYFVSIAGTLIPPERVHAFEPGPNFAWLDYNNRRLFAGRVRTNHGYMGADDYGRQVTGDRYADATGDPTVVKIDVDGAEAEVLAGAREMLSRAVPRLFLEIHFVGGPAYPELRARLIELLGSLPYRYRLCRNHRRFDAPLEPLRTLDDLPRERDDSFDDNDYLLVAERPPCAQ